MMLLLFREDIKNPWIESALMIYTLFTISTKFAESVEDLCPQDGNSICPCGKTEKSFKTKCNPLRSMNNACSKFSYCETCEDYKDICTSCPSGRHGPYCSSQGKKDKHFKELKKAESFKKTKDLTKRSVYCFPLQQPKFASLFCRTTGDQRECTIRCSSGYWFEELEVEKIVLKCKNGYWGPNPHFPSECRKINKEIFCPDPGTVTNGQDNRPARKTEFEVGATIQYACIPGFELVGNYILQCESSGLWTYPRPTCEEIPTSTSLAVTETEVFCPDPGSTPNGLDNRPIIKTNKFQIGSVVIYVCQPGFELIGNNILHCQASGQWTFPRPSCEKPLPSNTAKVLYDRCELGKAIQKQYPELEGNAEIHICVLCPSSKQYRVKEINCLKKFKHSECEIGCNYPLDWYEGFEVGELVLHCHNDFWDPDAHFPPDCSKRGTIKDIYCPNLEALGPDNQPVRKTIQFKVGESLIYVCTTNFESLSSNSHSLHCRLVGEATHPTPRCVRVPSDKSIATKVTYDRCELGGAIQKWRPDTFRHGDVHLCVLCPHLKQVRAKEVICLKRSGEGACIGICNDPEQWFGGFDTKKLVLQCHNGFWDVKAFGQPDCETMNNYWRDIYCPNPGLVKNGIVDQSARKDIEFKVNETMIYVCRSQTIETFVGHTLHCKLLGDSTINRARCEKIPPTILNTSN